MSFSSPPLPRFRPSHNFMWSYVETFPPICELAQIVAEPRSQAAVDFMRSPCAVTRVFKSEIGVMMSSGRAW
jgi:hypothetical protein